MTLSYKGIGRISLAIAFLVWFALLITELTILFSTVNNLESGIPPFLPPLLMDIFILGIFFYYKYRIGKAENINFLDMLWKVFVTGLLATVMSLLIQLLYLALGAPAQSENIFDIVLVSTSYYINLGLITTFLASAFIVWKRLIQYQKSKILLRSWRVYEYTLLASLAFNLFESPGFNRIAFIFMITLIIVGLVLSVNLKWVAYLNFKEKWKSILLILLILLYLGYFLQYFRGLTDRFPVAYEVMSNVFFICIFTFVVLYAFFSLLVILFNLPTTSVFEQKLEEVVNFQRLSQSIQTESSEEKVYEILLESSISTVMADAAWLELYNNESSTFYTHRITEPEIKNVKENIQKNNIKGILDTDTDKAVKSSNLVALRGTDYKSIVAFPIIVEKNQIATLALLKEVEDGFNKEMLEIIRTFVNQAGISIENFRLLEQALENERYKEELNIAKRVQSSLLPEKLSYGDNIDISAYSKAAAEVGGDYYDTFRINDNKTALIIGDVSGKGTSAAFHMSQMKGIFNSLAQLDLSPKEFLVKTNTALSRTLEKTSFITLSYFVVDAEKQTIDFARAGHCPTLYYDFEKKKAAFHTQKGLGLGIVRDDDFEKYIESSCLRYKPGDVLFLYTDGITEARNIHNEEYGYDRLKKLIMESAKFKAEEIKDKIVDSLYNFCDQDQLDDDYTIVIVKFNLNS